MATLLDFEKPVAELDGKIAELQHISHSGDMNIADEISRLRLKSERLLKQIYSELTPWQKVQVARHSDRPQFFDYLNYMVEDFIPLAGDRNFAEDQAIIGGIGRIDGQSVMVIGQQKGNDTESRLRHNFGMAKPEGYRKAQRLMELADRFKLPIVTFVDTAGAYPSVDAEERGQAEAIARCIETCLKVKTPFISIVIGEGGSGGAIAIAAANTVMMLEHSVYSVISPEGCASILWRSSSKAADAANALKLTAQDLHKLGVVDRVIPEPVGGAHRHKASALQAVKEAIIASLKLYHAQDGQKVLQQRRDKYLNIGDKGL
jgi:acetyl-CoA carboxylase carboxyl transferase subunit alpha